MQQISDKVEVSFDFPEKTYIGAFGRDAKFSVSVDPDGVLLKFLHGGSKRRVLELHFHPHLLADIMTELADALGRNPMENVVQRERLLDGIRAVEKALG